MSGKHTDGFEVNKKIFWKRITKKFNLEYPDLRVSLTSKLKEKALDYAEGYSECLKNMAEQPYKPEDIESHLFDVIIDYIVKKIG